MEFTNLPQGHFAAVVADPPWRFDTWSAKGRDRCPDGIKTRAEPRNNRPENHYETMTIDGILEMPVASLCAKDCVLFLWAVDPMVPQAIAVGEAWGFKYKTVGFYWVKLRKEGITRGEDQTEWDKKLFPMGTGYWSRPNPEQCLLFTRGKPKRVSANVRKLILAPRREHSRKPDETIERVEQLVSGPYLELFARTERPGWRAWGNETTKFNDSLEALL